MRNDYPEKLSGEVLTAKEWNRVSDHCRKMDRLAAGSFATLHHGGSVVSISGSPVGLVVPVLVISKGVGDGPTTNNGLYWVHPRVYSATTGEWLNVSEQYLMDERALGGIPGGFLVGDCVVCSWCSQAGVYIPLSPADVLRPSELDADLQTGDSAAAHFLVGEGRDGVGDSFTIYDLLSFITDGYELVDTTKVWTIWDRKVGKWVLGIPSNCESKILA